MLSKNNALRSILTKNQNLEYNENEFYKYLRQVRELKHKNNQRFLNCKGVHGYSVEASKTNPLIDSLNQANIHELNIKSSLARTKQANFNYNVLEELQPHEGKQTVRASMKKLLDYFPGLQQKEQEKFKSDLDVDKDILQADKSDDVLENENLMMGRNTEQAGVYQAYQMALELAIDRFHREYPSAVELGYNAGAFINRDNWSGTELLKYVEGNNEIFFQKNPQFFSQISNIEAAKKDPTNSAFRVEEVSLPASSNYMNDPKSKREEIESQYLAQVSEKLVEDVINAKTTLNSLQQQQLHPLEHVNNKNLLSIGNSNATPNVIDPVLGELSSSSNPNMPSSSSNPNLPIDQLMTGLLRLEQEEIKLLTERKEIEKELSALQLDAEKRFNAFIENNKNDPLFRKNLLIFLRNQKTANATGKLATYLQNEKNIQKRILEIHKQYREGRSLLERQQFSIPASLPEENLGDYIDQQIQELCDLQRISIKLEHERQGSLLAEQRKINSIHMNTWKMLKNLNLIKEDIDESDFDLFDEDPLEQFPNVSSVSTNKKNPFRDLPQNLPAVVLPYSDLESNPVPANSVAPMPVNRVAPVNPKREIIGMPPEIIDLTDERQFFPNLPVAQFPEDTSLLPLKKREPMLSPAERREAKKKQDREIEEEKARERIQAEKAEAKEKEEDQNPLPLDKNVKREEITPVKNISTQPAISKSEQILSTSKKNPTYSEKLQASINKDLNRPSDKPIFSPEWKKQLNESTKELTKKSESNERESKVDTIKTEKKQIPNTKRVKELTPSEKEPLQKLYDYFVKHEIYQVDFYEQKYSRDNLPDKKNLYDYFEEYKRKKGNSNLSYVDYRKLLNNNLNLFSGKKFIENIIRGKGHLGKGVDANDEQSDEEQTESTGKGKRKRIDDSITISSEFAPLGTGFLHIPSAHNGRVRITDEKGQDIPSLCFEASSNLCRALLAKSKGRALGRLGARDAQTARVILHALQGEAIAPPQNAKKQRKELLESMLHNGNDSQGVKDELKHMMDIK